MPVPIPGDPNKNESHFAWDKPIRCIEDGKVTAVIDDIPDNFGQSPNPANNPRRNSSIVVEHAGGNFSLYHHVRKGGATTKVGQSVKAKTMQELAAAACDTPVNAAIFCSNS